MIKSLLKNIKNSVEKTFSVIFECLKRNLKIVKVVLFIVSFISFSLILSWKFSILIMFSVWTHESGHLWAMKKCGLKTSGFFFIPFMGGAAVQNEVSLVHEDISFIAIMGPIFGAATSFVLFILYLITKNEFIAVSANWVAIMNLFNLLPIGFLDGSKFLRSLIFSINKIAGYAFMLLTVFAGGFALGYFRELIFIYLIIFGIFEGIAILSLEKKYGFVFHKMTKKLVIENFILYCSVVVLLVLMIYFTKIPNTNMYFILQ